jgi:hypothetical protein
MSDAFENGANQAPGISGFGGHLLAPDEDGEMVAEALRESRGGGYLHTLASLGIRDAEQLVSLAFVPELRDHLRSALNLREVEFHKVMDRAVSILPEDRQALLVRTPGRRDVGLGVLPPTEEMITAAEVSAGMSPVEFNVAAAALPSSVSLIPFMPPIRDQRARGTCVSFALTALNEYVLRRAGVTRDLSEQHLYYEIKLIDGAPDGCGTWQRKAVSALRDRGQCREPTWPYNPNEPCNNHGSLPPRARFEGQNFRLRTVEVPARSVSAYKTHLSQQRPVTVSVPVYDSWFTAEVRRSGRLTMRLGSEPVTGGHAVCLVGYQDTPTSPGGGYFLVRNSWNTTWAYESPYGGGYGTIPYQYIANEAWEAFTASFAATTDQGGGEEEGEDGGGPRPGAGKATVTIDVAPQIRITITSG